MLNNLISKAYTVAFRKSQSLEENTIVCVIMYNAFGLIKQSILSDLEDS